MAGDYTGDTLWDFGNIYQKTKKIKITKYIQVYYEKAESNLFKTDGLRRLWFHLPQKVYR